MAIDAEIIVRDVKIKDSVVQTTGKQYQTIVIADGFGSTYNGLVTKELMIPEINDKIKITYQDVKGYKSILNIQEGLTVTKTTTSKTTETKEVKESKDNTQAGSMFKIKGTTNYAHIKDRDTKGEYASNKYKLDLSVSQSTKNALEELGVLVKNKGDAKGDFVTIKSDYQPSVDIEGTRVLASDIPLIGNGSKAIITVTTYKNKAKEGGKVCLGMKHVDVTELVKYEAPMLTDEE